MISNGDPFLQRYGFWNNGYHHCDGNMIPLLPPQEELDKHGISVLFCTLFPFHLHLALLIP